MVDLKRVTITIDRNIESFDSYEQKEFIRLLSFFINANPGQIQIVWMEKGSVILTLEIPNESANILLSLFLENAEMLSKLRITDVQIISDKDDYSGRSPLKQTTTSNITKTKSSILNRRINPSYEHSVFISYAWGDEREEIVNKIDQALQNKGLKIIRDKRDLEYKGSINEFMERIGRGDCVIVVVSDKYLRSPNCMYELVEIADNKDFQNRTH